MDHPKSQALHIDPRMPIGRESKAVPTPWWVGLSSTPCAVQGTTSGWECHQGHSTTPLAQHYVQQQEHPPGPLTGLPHGGLCVSDTTKDVCKTSVPSSYGQGGMAGDSLWSRLGQSGNALTPKEWATRLPQLMSAAPAFSCLRWVDSCIL